MQLLKLFHQHLVHLYNFNEFIKLNLPDTRMESSSSSNWRNRKPNQNWRRGQRPEARSSASYSNFETHGAEASQWRDQSSSNKVKFKSRDQTNAGSTSRGHGTNINQRGSENYRGQKGNRGDNRGGSSQPPRPIGYGL